MWPSSHRVMDQRRGRPRPPRRDLPLRSARHAPQPQGRGVERLRGPVRGRPAPLLGLPVAGLRMHDGLEVAEGSVHHEAHGLHAQRLGVHVESGRRRHADTVGPRPPPVIRTRYGTPGSAGDATSAVVVLLQLDHVSPALGDLAVPHDEDLTHGCPHRLAGHPPRASSVISAMTTSSCSTMRRMVTMGGPVGTPGSRSRRREASFPWRRKAPKTVQSMSSVRHGTGSGRYRTCWKPVDVGLDHLLVARHGAVLSRVDRTVDA